jgi:3-deoxy-D-arabino-heptulosonate 7-phosphate (DAHP) synthase
VGFVFLATVTGIGGGTVRDLILGVPVFWVADPMPVILCGATAIAVYFTAHLVEYRYRWLLWCDAVALAAYGVFGAFKGYAETGSGVIAVVMAALTGSFGGILRDVLDLGLPTATELLDPITPQYIADLISWSAIGARTTESQTHRQMASGLSMPLGFKNGTFGHITPAINAIKAAMQPQTFLGVSDDGVASAVTTSGNPDCHIILRGGESGPNYGADNVMETIDGLEAAKLKPAIMIDASHGNCAKDHRRMPDVFREIVRQRAAGQKAIIGAMLESNLVGGSQKFPQPLDQLVRGQSITDACIDWETTEALLREAHTALK